MNSRNKGKRAELALKNELSRILGTEYERTAQHCGKDGIADVRPVDGDDGIHWECKWNEKLNLREAVEQAVSDSVGGVPTVVHKKNGQPWLVTIRLDDLPQFVVNLYLWMVSNE